MGIRCNSLDVVKCDTCHKKGHNAKNCKIKRDTPEETAEWLERLARIKEEKKPKHNADVRPSDNHHQAITLTQMTTTRGVYSAISLDE
jgi:hypothetical protein